MTSTDQTIIALLNDLIKTLSKPDNRDFYLLFTGGFLGFFGSYLIYIFQERKRKYDKFAKYLVDLYSLMEEIRQNAIVIRTDGYLLEYYSTLTALQFEQNIYNGENNGVFQMLKNKVDSRIKDKEILSSRMVGKIAEHNIYFGEKKQINEANKKLGNFELTKNNFLNVKDIDELKRLYDSKFYETIKEEMANTYTPLLFNLITLITDSVNYGKDNRLKRIFKKKV